MESEEDIEEALVPQVLSRRAVGSRLTPQIRWKKLLFVLLATSAILVGKTRFEEASGSNNAVGRREVPGTRLWTGGDCSSGLRLEDMLHRNLGGYGPDSGEESMIFRLVGGNGTEVEMVMVALNSDFHLWKPHKMGIKDGFGVVTTSGLSRLVANVSFRSSKTKHAVTLPQLALSFYDIHMRHKVNSRKAVKILDVVGNWTDVVRTNNSVVALHQNMTEGSVTFTATDRGALEDLTDPEHISLAHFSRVVSLHFSHVHSFKLELQSGAGSGHQPFQFTAEAAVLCAATPQGQHPAADFIQNHQLQESLREEHGEVAIRAGKAAFQSWLVAPGDVVDESDSLYTVVDDLGNTHQVQSHVYGQVVELLSDLLPGDALQPGTALMVIKLKSRIPWTLLAWVMGGCGCAAVIVAIVCCSSSPSKPPPPLVVGENDAVVLEFRTPTGWLQTGIWRNKPLGLGFHQSLPAVVAYVSEDAMQYGVVEDDELVRLGTESQGLRPISHKSYEEFWTQLCDLVSQLPEVPRLMLEFETSHGIHRQIEWKTKPLGVSFDQVMPMKVTEVHEEALHLNIKVGDKLKRYGLETNNLQTTEGKTFDEVFSDISGHMANFPTAIRMICEFELPDKTVREFMWHAKPLGLAFGSDSPPVVSKVTFPADKKGVKEGYILRRFGSDYRMMEATEDRSYSRTMADIQKFEKLLPDARSEVVDAW